MSLQKVAVYLLAAVGETSFQIFVSTRSLQSCFVFSHKESHVRVDRKVVRFPPVKGANVRLFQSSVFGVDIKQKTGRERIERCCVAHGY